MTASQAQFILAHDQVFSQRCQQLAVKSAIAVAAEDPATANHAARIAWGNKVLKAPGDYALVIAQAVVTNAAISAESADSDIEFTINSQWNAFALA